LENYISKQKLQLSSENKAFIIELLDTKKIKFDRIKDLDNDLYIRISESQLGSILLIYDLLILCRKGKNSISVMIPDIMLNNIKIYFKNYIFE
jgi:hypothetical protein